MRARLPAALIVAAVLTACSAAAPAVPDATDTPAGDATSGLSPGPTCAADVGLASVPPLHPSVDAYPEVVVELVGPAGDCRIAVAVRHADTPATRAHGLMEVPDLPGGTGMLFTYPDVDAPRTGGYWMKGTLVPLDIAYLGADGTIQQIVAMEPCTSDPCPSYPPERPYRATLEVAQGWFASVGVAAGWRVDLPT